MLSSLISNVNNMSGLMVVILYLLALNIADNKLALPPANLTNRLA